METTTATGQQEIRPDAVGRPFDWFRTLSRKGRRAFFGAFGGYALDSYDFQVLPLVLGAIASYFAISTGEAGLLITVTLVVSAVGGALAGVLCDKIGRIRTLQLTVATYTVFTVLCGFAPNFETLLVFRALQGLGFGGEWAAGAILVAEFAEPKYRGRAVEYVQSSWAVGWGLAVLVYTIVFQVFSEDIAWRVLFWTGAIPALLIIWVRRPVTDTEAVTEKRSAAGTTRGSFTAIFRRDLLRTTFFASLLATGVQGGYCTLAPWLPTYVKKSHELDVVGTGDAGPRPGRPSRPPASHSRLLTPRGTGAHIAYRDLVGFGRRAIDMRPADMTAANRAYTSTAGLAPSSGHHTVLGVEANAKQAFSLATTGTASTVDGTTVHVLAQSICGHGDSPGSVDVARSVRASLEADRVVVEAFT